MSLNQEQFARFASLVKEKKVPGVYWIDEDDSINLADERGRCMIAHFENREWRVRRILAASICDHIRHLLTEWEVFWELTPTCFCFPCMEMGDEIFNQGSKLDWHIGAFLFAIQQKQVTK